MTRLALHTQVLGAWQLLRHEAILPGDERDKTFPMGNPHGMVLLTADGHMSFQVWMSNSMSQMKREEDRSADTTEESGDLVFAAWTGSWTLDEDETTPSAKLTVQILLSNSAGLLGSTQKRLVNITHENGRECLVLQTQQAMNILGTDRFMRLYWVRVASDEPVGPSKKG
ncbi:hypothetical protein NX059_000532 [Plenodomus lindquistii]|nr:hypothetical protein NX059_000532 [Plenodomus lindquistii]